MALIKLVCTETKIRRAYSLIVAFLTGGLDFILIICSYVLILFTVFNLPSKAARLKTLSTCVSHVWVILVFYTPAFFSFLTHRFGHHIAPHIHIFVANIYLLIPPMMNPIIYGVKTKRIRERFFKFLTIKCVWKHIVFLLRLPFVFFQKFDTLLKNIFFSFYFKFAEVLVYED